MAETVAMYKTVAPLNAEKHRNLSLKPGADFAFASGLTSAPLGVSEIAEASCDMPVVFAREGETVAVLAVMGLTTGRNDMIDADNGWRGRYVPAFLRRYPFILTEPNDENRQALCFDESFEGFNTEGRGERLFDADGEQTAYTKSVVGFAQRVHAELMRTRGFASRLDALGLLEETEATIRQGEGEPRRVRGFSAVSREKLAALPDATMLEMARSGELELIHLHLASLKAFSALRNDAAQPNAAA